MRQDLRVIILAAGKGTRMKSSRPKVLHKICGEPILKYVLYIAETVGSLKTYVVLGHESGKVRDYLPKDVSIVKQRQLLGTADAVKRAQNNFKGYGGDILILCGDTPLLRKATIHDIIKKHRQSKAAVTFLTAQVEDPQGYGRIIRDYSNAVTAIVEDKDLAHDQRKVNEINAGVYCFKSQELFANLNTIELNKKKKEFYLTDIIELYLNKNLKISTVRAKDSTEGLGINSREDLAVAQGLTRRRILKDFMRQGITIVDPTTTFIDAGVKLGRDTIIHPFTFIEKDVRVGRDCIIGPYARLRTGTSIGNRVEVGNFTEISRTKIGNRCFMKHFSFLGDTEIGSDVNIGAGVITANFDGKQKHSTFIGDKAFIGSDSILVAPVKIGKRAATGAGSVVTKGKEVPDGKIAVGMPARIISRRKN